MNLKIFTFDGILKLNVKKPVRQNGIDIHFTKDEEHDENEAVLINGKQVLEMTKIVKVRSY